MNWLRVVALVSLAAALAGWAGGAGAARRDPPLMPPGWKQVQTGPAGGTVWRGDLPGAPFGPSFTPSFVYLPPRASRSTRYPVLYVLHGFRGSPSSIVDGVALGTTADQLIQQGTIRAFIAVVPSGNGTTKYGGEWTGGRETFVVKDVIPWVDANLPTIATRAGRTIAGLSAGAYGAVDIALRNPKLFSTAESWSGYFKPIRDGTLRNASPQVLAAHDPSRLVVAKAPLLRRLGTRFYLSSGSTRDRRTAAFARAFSLQLKALGIAHTLVLRPGAHNGAFWRAQLPAALTYAFGTSAAAGG